MQIEKVNNGDKLHFLSTMIDDPLVTDEKKAKYLSQYIPINYENKEWQSKHVALFFSKAELQEHCRKARLSILTMMNNGNHTDAHEKLLFDISQRKIDELIDGEIEIGSRSPNKFNKRVKK
ncbi:unnamed protein product [Rotaria sp. Silwood1]|nr:unnamed protein product [Rotaria sp. Silwood1]